jgi:TrpR-related protein YerC/YecD
MSANSRLKDPFIDALFEALMLLENEEEYYRFFEDIMTVGEIKSFAQRLAVAKMLDRNETYLKIAEVTGASTATISRVKKCLYYGADGYRLVLNRLQEKKAQEASS